MKHLLRSARTWRLRFRSLPSSQTLTSHSSRRIHSSLSPKVESASAKSSYVSDVSSSRVFRGDLGMFPAVLAGLFGIGLVETAYSEEANEDNEDVQEIAKKERQRIQDLLTTKGIRQGSYPRFNVAVKGQKVSIKFQIPPGCEVSQLIANLTAHLGLKSEGHGGGSDMKLRAWDSTVAWQLILTHPSKQNHIQQNEPSSTDTNAHDRDLCILIFHSLIGSDKVEIEFMKQGNMSAEELDAFVSILQLAGNKLVERNPLEKKTREETEQAPSIDKSISSLEAMGVRTYGLNEPIGISNGDISWDIIAGYEHQKRVIEDTVLLALRSPEVYDDIARGTRHKFESNRPRAVLFEGPPGTGKTSCARVIANQAGVPLLYVPLEVVMSEFYGKSERLLGKVFSLANDLPNGAIIFLDEIDSFAAARDNDMHEATRRMLSVLLRQIDGFEQDKKVVVIAATNRKEDLDPALIDSSLNSMAEKVMMEEEDSLENGTGSGHGIRRVSSRAEVDTSMPFESVKEAVTRFGGSGPWLPLYRLGEAYTSIEDFDIKKIEEQAAKLEKDLIMKELETLDVLEELGSAKTILEKLKQQLQSEALKCCATQDVNSCEQIKAPVKNYENNVNHREPILQSPIPCAASSPDMFLTELKEAKRNLGKTITDLGTIQSSVETLNKKMKKERLFLERTRENLHSKFAAISAQNVAKKETSKPPESPVEKDFTFDIPQNVARDFKLDVEQYNGMVESRSTEVLKQGIEYGENEFSIKNAEMRWFAAKKMEEAAMAAEAVALAEIKALSGVDISSRFSTREHQKVTSALEMYSTLNPEFQMHEESILKKIIHANFKINEASASKLTILKKLEEATDEVQRSKQILTEALNGIENANRKQRAAEEALRRWIPENNVKGRAMHNSIKRNKFNVVQNRQASKPAVRSSVSMRDLLSRKQVTDDYTITKEMEEHAETKVALSQMLRSLKENQTLPTEHENDGGDQKQSVAQRKMFGFIRISFPLGKRNDKKT